MRSFTAGIALCVFAFISSPFLLGQSKKIQSKTLATIDDTVITETQVRDNGAGDLEMLELQELKAKALAARSEQDILEKTLNRLIEEKLLESEAANKGITKEKLLETEVQSQVKEPTQEEIDNVYKANAERIKKTKEEITPQIKEYLKQRKAQSLRRELLNRLETEHKVNRFIQPLRFSVDAPGRPSSGQSSAPVTIVTFSDFQCPYCKEYTSVLKEAQKTYGDKLRIVFRQFPLTSIHANAQKAAEASLCAANQNKFWEMHDQLFQTQSLLNVKDLKGKAKDLGLDTAAFDACLDGGRSAALVHEDMVAGFRAGVEGTPSTFINGMFVNGVIPIDALKDMIDDELARGEKPSNPAASGAAKK
jgi:protein-disulfide isomerase